MPAPNEEKTAPSKADLQELLNPSPKISSASTFAHILYLRRWWILLSWLAVGVPAAVFLAFYDLPQTYSSTAYLRFPHVVGADQTMARDAGLNQAESIVRLIRSRSVLHATLRNLDLRFQVTTPDVFRRDVFASVEYPDDAAPGRYAFTFQPKGKVTVAFQSFATGRKTRLFAGPIPEDRKVSLPGLAFQVHPGMLGVPEPFKFDAVLLPEDKALEDFQERLEVGALEVEDRVRVNFAVTLEGNDPFLTAETLNDLVRSFMDAYARTGQTQDGKVLAQMEKSLEAARAKELEAQDRLAAFLARHPALQAAQPRETPALRVTAQADLRLYEERLENLQQLLNRRPNPGDPLESRRGWVSDAVFLLNSYGVMQVNSIQAKVSEAETRRAQLLAEVVPTHPRVRSIEEEIAALRPELERVLAVAQRTWTQKLGRARAEVHAAMPETAPVSADLEARRLTLEKDNASRTVEGLEADYDRARLAAGSDLFKIHVVDEARPAEYLPPGIQRRLGFVIGAFLLAGILCVFWVLGRQVFQARIYSHDDVKRKLRAKVLGGIFYHPVPEKPLSLPAPGEAAKPVAPAVAPGEAEPRLLHWGSGSTFLLVENFRLLGSQIKAHFPSASGLAFLVTSTQPGEGKTLFSANAAISFARAGRRTLLVDADMRRGRLSRILGVKPGPGLMEVLASPDMGEETRLLLSQAIVAMPEPNLYFLGRGLDRNQAGDSSAKEKFKSLVPLLRQAFDVLVVDTPPVIVAADPLNMMEALPNVVFLIRSGETKAADAQEAIDRAAARNIRLTCVLNALMPSPFLKNHFAKYGYYYRD